MIGWIRTATFVVTTLVLGVSVVRADAPGGKEIADVVVSGNNLRTTADILAVFGVRAGQNYVEETIRSSIDKLYAKGWFTSNGIELKTIEKPDGRVTVILYVTELTSFISDIQYIGADHLGRTELDTLTGLRRGMAMSPHLNQQARLNILRKYQESGRVHASVTIREGNKLGDSKVIFDIVEGPVVKIADIDFKFVGIHESGITAGRLREQLTISRAKLAGLIGGDYNPAQIDYDVVKLTEYYHGLGFLDTKVSRELTYSADHRYVTVTFFVAEGKRYKVGRVQITGNTVYNESKLLEFTDLRENNFYDKTTISADLRRIRDLYGYSGRPVGVREEHPEPEPGKGVVHVHYQIVEAPQMRVGEVKIVGNPITRDSVIRREIPLYPGQVLEYPALEQATGNLERLGIFKNEPQNGIKPTIEVIDPQGDSPFKDLLVTVQEAQTGSFLLGAGVNSDAGVTGSIVLNERNFDITRIPTSFDEILDGRAFRGGGQELRLEAVPGNVFQRYTASWRDPRLFDSLYSLSLSGYYYTRGYNEFTEGRYGGRATLGRRISQNWTVNTSVRVEGVDISGIPYYAPPEITNNKGYSFLLGMGGGLRRDTRDNYIRPSSGSVFDINVEQVLGDYQYPIGTVEYTSFFTTYSRLDGSGKHVLAMRSQASFTDSNAPVYERFYAGGFRSMRGFQFRGVGPHFADLNTGGDFAFLNSIEYQIPVVPSDSLYVVGFIDSGTVSQNISLKDYRVTAGVGLRISMPQLLGPVPLALDFGFPLNQAPGDKKQVFSFWVGMFGQ